MASRTVVTLTGVVAVSCSLLGIVMLVASDLGWSELASSNLLPQSVAAVSTAVTGTVILQRLPGHAVGRLFLLVGVLAGIDLLAYGLTAQMCAAAWMAAR